MVSWNSTTGRRRGSAPAATTEPLGGTAARAARTVGPAVDVARAEDADDLIRALAVRGLAGRVEHSERGCRVHVSATGAGEDVVLLEVLVAVETWLADRGLPSVLLRLGDRTYRLHARRS